jgi:DNA topoisomerase-1
MMKEFYDQFHPVKDVEANAERESGERILGTDPGTGKPVSVRLEIWWLKLVMPKTKTKKFASLMNEQNIEQLLLKRH